MQKEIVVEQEDKKQVVVGMVGHGRYNSRLVLIGMFLLRLVSRFKSRYLR